MKLRISSCFEAVKVIRRLPTDAPSVTQIDRLFDCPLIVAEAANPIWPRRGVVAQQVAAEMNPTQIAKCNLVTAEKVCVLRKP